METDDLINTEIYRKNISTYVPSFYEIVLRFDPVSIKEPISKKWIKALFVLKWQ